MLALLISWDARGFHQPTGGFHHGSEVSTRWNASGLELCIWERPDAASNKALNLSYLEKSPFLVKTKSWKSGNLDTFCHIVQNHGFIFRFSWMFFDIWYLCILYPSILLGHRANGRPPGSDAFDFSANDHRCRPQSLAHRPNSDASVRHRNIWRCWKGFYPMC